MHIQESAEKALNPHFWLTLGALHKREVMASVEMSTSLPSVEGVSQQKALNKVSEVSIPGIKGICPVISIPLSK